MRSYVSVVRVNFTTTTVSIVLIVRLPFPLFFRCIKESFITARPKERPKVGIRNAEVQVNYRGSQDSLEEGPDTQSGDHSARRSRERRQNLPRKQRRAIVSWRRLGCSARAWLAKR